VCACVVCRLLGARKIKAFYEHWWRPRTASGTGREQRSRRDVGGGERVVSQGGASSEQGEARGEGAGSERGGCEQRARRGTWGRARVASEARHAARAWREQQT
jgi:hypothetical protein